ncbi:MAG: CoA transferase [Chloroflexi bacterium]|uniref:CaiB/BaiF CoA transferase family protein n=1 Tax=Candidatus Flexifilum breve TaxID=3140694 RepID=UPI003135B616|nr:CoA transferase [Chloroflexota bacterium]
MTKPLQGIRVLDLTRLLPGGVATLMLADLGAEIIKIEAPGGGDYARWMPPLIDEQGAYFGATNRGKQSIILNLKDERGQAVLQRMAASADVLIESNRPGVLDRLNVGYDTLKAINPRLVFCALSGWGATGPYAQRSGHDLNYISEAGLLGEMNSPQPFGGQVADLGSAYAAVAGICAALFGRERTGEGAFLDISLFEAALPFMTISWVEAISAGDHIRGRLSGKMACYNVYTTSDGQSVTLAALEPKFWTNFCTAINRPDLIEGYEKPERQRYLLAELEQIFALKTAAEWAAQLEPADCCFSRVMRPSEALNHPQIEARRSLEWTWSEMPVIHSPIRSGDLPELAPVPGYGEHTRAVLLSFGYTEAEIDELTAQGVVQA